MTTSKTVYNVHLYREMRLYFPGIAAGSHEEAARLANQKPTNDAVYIEDCDGETLSALVDVENDEEFAESRIVDFEPARLRRAAGDLLSAAILAEEVLSRLARLDNGTPSVSALHLLRAAIAQATMQQEE